MGLTLDNNTLRMGCMNEKTKLTPERLDFAEHTPIARGVGVISNIVEKRPPGRPRKVEPTKSLKQRVDDWPLAIDANTVTLDVIVAKYLRLIELTSDISEVDARGKPILFDGGATRAALKDLAEILGYTGTASGIQPKTVNDLDALESMIKACREAVSKENTIDCEVVSPREK